MTVSTKTQQGCHDLNGVSQAPSEERDLLAEMSMLSYKNPPYAPLPVYCLRAKLSRFRNTG